MRVLVVGAGNTGALISFMLKGLKPYTCLKVWEKSRGCGGRMATSRRVTNNQTEIRADIGAQYISNIPKYQQPHSWLYSQLVKDGVLEEYTNRNIVNERQYEDNTKHYLSTTGLSSISKYLIQNSDAEVSFERHLSRLEVCGSEVKVTSSGGDEEIYDLVILTQPAPQILQIQNISEILSDDIQTGLRSVEFSSRYVLIIHTNVTLDLNYTCMYVNDNDCVRFISVDNIKRKLGADNGTTLVVHTSVPFGKKHLEADKKDMIEVILPYVRQVVPSLPENNLMTLNSHKWRYSQVSRAYPDTPGCIVAHRVDDKPQIILAGDSYTHSNFDGCILSAQTVINQLL